MKVVNAWVLVVTIVCASTAATVLAYHHETEITSRLCIAKVPPGAGITQCDK